MKSWRDAVVDATLRQTDANGRDIFTNEELKRNQLAQIVKETGSRGRTPHQTLNRVLQELREEGLIEFVDDRGTYRLIGASPSVARSLKPRN
jgi:DNA-binding IclR family transcriptional regulator